MSRDSSRLRAVSRGHPCEVCGGDHKCSTSADGLLLCGRRDGPVDGFRHLGPAKDPTWHLYRAADDGPVVPVPPPPARSKPRDWPTQARLYATQFTPAQQADLAQRVGVPAFAFDEFLIGYQAVSPDGPAYLFPEYDGQADIVGLHRRYAAGPKRSAGQRGLYLPLDWRKVPGPVFCPEGASDTLTLRALGLLGVGRPSCRGGLDALASLLAGFPASRPLVIVGENDAKPDGSWPGRDGAVETARELQRRLDRPVLWALPPDDLKDVNDWAKAQGLPLFGAEAEDLWRHQGLLLQAHLLGAARPPDAPAATFTGPPLPLAPVVPAPPFPLAALPGPVQVFVDEAAESLQCPRDYVGVGVLAVAGAAVGNAWRLAVTASHEQPPLLFAGLVGPPGSAKSPALAVVCQPLHDANAGWLREWERLLDAAAERPKEARPPRAGLGARRCLVDDFTTEGLVPILQANPKGVVVVKDELAGLVHGLNQYKGGRGSDRQVLLGLWSQGDVVVDRKGEEKPILVRRPFVAVLGGIQPTVLDALRPRAGQARVEDGLLDRFVFCYPEREPPRGETWRVLSAEARDGWAAAVCRLLAQRGHEADGQPWRLHLGEEARGVWADFCGRHAGEVGRDDFPPELHGPWSKLRGYAGRLALVLHGLEWAVAPQGAPTCEVAGPTMANAVRLVDYFKGHARKVHGAIQASPVLDGCRAILAWLRRHPNVHRFTRSEAYQPLRRSFKTPAGLDEPLLMLAELRYVQQAVTGRVAVWEVNPTWRRG